MTWVRKSLITIVPEEGLNLRTRISEKKCYYSFRNIYKLWVSELLSWKKRVEMTLITFQLSPNLIKVLLVFYVSVKHLPLSCGSGDGPPFAATSNTGFPDRCFLPLTLVAEQEVTDNPLTTRLWKAIIKLISTTPRS